MRLFAAVVPPPDALADLSARLDRPMLDRSMLGQSVRWAPVEQWHVTLAFFGEVAEHSVPELAERLGRAAGRSEPVTLRLGALTGFPRPARAVVVVASVLGDVPVLNRLAQRCTAAGRRTGLVMEDRRFRAHLTIGRVRRRGESVDVRGLLADCDGPPWQVRELRLVQSTLGAEVRHTTLDRWPLPS